MNNSLCSRCKVLAPIAGQRWCRPCLTGYQRARRSDWRQRRAAVRGQAAAAKTLSSADELLRRMLADGAEGPSGHEGEPGIEDGGDSRNPRRLLAPAIARLALAKLRAMEQPGPLPFMEQGGRFIDVDALRTLAQIARELAVIARIEDELPPALAGAGIRERLDMDGLGAGASNGRVTSG